MTLAPFKPASFPTMKFTSTEGQPTFASFQEKNWNPISGMNITMAPIGGNQNAPGQSTGLSTNLQGAVPQGLFVLPDKSQLGGAQGGMQGGMQGGAQSGMQGGAQSGSYMVNTTGNVPGYYASNNMTTMPYYGTTSGPINYVTTSPSGYGATTMPSGYGTTSGPIDYGTTAPIGYGATTVPSGYGATTPVVYNTTTPSF